MENKLERCEELALGLIKIANDLENYRMKIYQEKTCNWEEDKQTVDDKLFKLQSDIRGVAEIVKYMDFEADK